jgi:hypothetical protein
MSTSDGGGVGNMNGHSGAGSEAVGRLQNQDLCPNAAQ